MQCQLTALRGRREETPLGKYTKPMVYSGQREAPGLTVQVTATDQVTNKLLGMHPLFLYVPLYLLIQDRAFYTQVIRRVRLGRCSAPGHSRRGAGRGDPAAG